MSGTDFSPIQKPFLLSAGICQLLADLYTRSLFFRKRTRSGGFGRYDVVLEPKQPSGQAYILEFKVHDPKSRQTLEDTADAALAQIQEKHYDAALLARGIPQERIRCYGFAFEGKRF